MRFKKVPKHLESVSRQFLARKCRRPVTIHVEGTRDYTSCYESAYYDLTLDEARALRDQITRDIEEAEAFLAQFEVEDE